MIRAELLTSDEGIETYGVIDYRQKQPTVLFHGLKFEVLAFLCGMLSPIVAQA